MCWLKFALTSRWPSICSPWTRIFARSLESSIGMDLSSNSHITFGAATPESERVTVMAPILNKILEDFDSGKSKQGVEAFDNEIMQRLDASGLLEKGKICQVERVGVHPDNREKSMLVPIDVQDLLARLATDGFNWSRWNAFACRIPTGALGDAWKEKNMALVRDSEGFLAPYNPDTLELLTGRGSHGTAALRGAKLGAKAIHAGLAGADGNISASKLCESQPSFTSPLSRGCPYDVVPAALVVAVPRLMEILSRTGNAGNNVFREQTVIQHCNRIHAIAVTKTGPLDWQAIARQACIGMGGEFLKDAELLCEFVKAWSGGATASILKGIEEYERTLAVKRKIYPCDMHELSKIDLFDAHKYVPAMVKTMLNAPSANSTGHGTLFTSADYASLQHGGRSRPFAIEANKMMIAAETFLLAYATMPQSTLRKLLSDLEVRLVMHVHQKRCDTRRSFASVLEIANHMYDAAKAHDVRLPVWTKLRDFEVKPKAAAASSSLREIRPDGLIPDSELEARGYTVNEVVLNQELEKHTIMEFTGDLKSVVVTKQGSDATFEISRIELLNKWVVHVAKESLFCTEHPDPTTHPDLLIDISKGAIKTALLHEFLKSSEEWCSLQISPQTKVFATKGFNKVGGFKLVGLTTSVNVLNKNAGGICMGICFENGGRVFSAYAKSSLCVPTAAKASGYARTAAEPFVAKYWACMESLDLEKTNCEQGSVSIQIKVGAETRMINIPIITNSKPIKVGDEIVVSKQSVPTEPEEPAKKHAKTGAKGIGKGKRKNKK
jgi:hypothetical protein